ncbi:hypothetical protein CLAFUW4_05383 [Fulvia fulva]|uniref:Uncharacterized protein n=1 Tax=Passalora fulva TaxID=5499 RepID=A0A9Q8LIX9_PASFU|nr:uncharacterized protein CLAFUR5_05531 [Fulvia fulva]KAK4624671.1 hypothetical protein CLAFUR4_05377 [Fulvia fulva]KAK4625083.1 hypothetical protein CLAFUR0_05385 [Fulvia fulva]UJO17979.1 hypothetical protein CLAFUR5_05531 [Fulvia fulva]WPV15626.1 hypothetical protein CLAFUW4_05383 [Fulvia fulva]WPV30463.1 hypothetical protein CLAFUW7_05381 [Fulvia fulva]
MTDEISHDHYHERGDSCPGLEKIECNHTHTPLQTSENIEAHLKDLDARVQALLKEVQVAHVSASAALNVAVNLRDTGDESDGETVRLLKKEGQRLDEETERFGNVYKALVEESLEIRGRVDMGDPSVMRHINVEEDMVGVLRVRLEELELEVGRVGGVVAGLMVFVKDG